MPLEDHPIRLKGEDADEALRDWVKIEIRDSPKLTYELGRFFFSVSVGTAGVLAAIEKLNASPTFDLLLLCCMLLLLASTLVALYIATPAMREVGGSTDPRQAYIAQAKWSRIQVWLWFAFWLSGTIVGGLAVRK